jgi:hypothetical protein
MIQYDQAAAARMAAFDRLPKAVRRALMDGPTNPDPRYVMKAYKRATRNRTRYLAVKQLCGVLKALQVASTIKSAGIWPDGVSPSAKLGVPLLRSYS